MSSLLTYREERESEEMTFEDKLTELGFDLIDEVISELWLLAESCIINPEEEVKVGLSFCDKLTSSIRGFGERGVLKGGNVQSDVVIPHDLLSQSIEKANEGLQGPIVSRSLAVQRKMLSEAYDRFVVSSGGCLLTDKEKERVMELSSLLFESLGLDMPETPVECLRYVRTLSTRHNGGLTKTEKKFFQSRKANLEDELKVTIVSDYFGRVVGPTIPHDSVEDCLDRENKQNTDVSLLGSFDDSFGVEDARCSCRFCADNRKVASLNARAILVSLSTERPDGLVIPRVRRDGEWVTKSGGHPVKNGVLKSLREGFLHNLDAYMAGRSLAYPDQEIRFTRDVNGRFLPVFKQRVFTAAGGSARKYRCYSCRKLTLHVLDGSPKQEKVDRVRKLYMDSLRLRLSVDPGAKDELVSLEARTPKFWGTTGNWRCVMCGDVPRHDAVTMTYRTRLSSKPDAVTWVADYHVYGNQFKNSLRLVNHSLFERIFGCKERKELPLSRGKSAWSVRIQLAGGRQRELWPDVSCWWLS